MSDTVSDTVKRLTGRPAAGVRVGFDNKSVYKCPELRPFDGRPGAMDAFKLPSVRGSSVVWPKGSAE